ncbi:MAG: acylphosphatase [Chloroflexi bacterium]|nr:acylphosphatase [Chloroflexota bacterium]
MGEETKRIVSLVRGRVQGVAFRYHTALKANQLGLEGWVRNNEDGSVQIEAQGQESSLNDLIGYIQKGPAHAKVDEVETKWIKDKESSGRFRIVR